MNLIRVHSACSPAPAHDLAAALGGVAQLLSVVNMTRVRCGKWPALTSSARGRSDRWSDRRPTHGSVENSRQTLSDVLTRVPAGCFAHGLLREEGRGSMAVAVSPNAPCRSGCAIQRERDAWQATPCTGFFVGARHQWQNDTSAGLSRTESNEAAIFAGLFHRL